MSIVCSKYKGAFLRDDGIIVRGDILFEILHFDTFKNEFTILSKGTEGKGYPIKLSQLFNDEQIQEVINLIIDKFPHVAL